MQAHKRAPWRAGALGAAAAGLVLCVATGVVCYEAGRAGGGALASDAVAAAYARGLAAASSASAAGGAGGAAGAPPVYVQRGELRTDGVVVLHDDPRDDGGADEDGGADADGEDGDAAADDTDGPEGGGGAPPPLPDEPVFRNIFYLKTHKTGSTSIANGLVRYARRHGLTTVRAPGHVYITGNNTSGRVADALVAHHAAFDLPMVATYLRGAPELVLTSLRLPLQRQLSWFRQQNTHFERADVEAGSEACRGMEKELLEYFDGDWKERMSASQWFTLMERHHRDQLSGNASAILDQFDFVFLRERLRESYECMCAKTGVRLCDAEHPVAELNVKPSNSCTEQTLLEKRAEELLRGAARDVLLYELVDAAISRCQDALPDHCRCARE